MNAPTIRQISWIATIPQFAAIAVLIIISCFGFGVSNGLLIGTAVYLIYSFVSRLLVARDHRRGIGLLRKGQFKEAIQAFEASYRFFSEHLWIDRFRSIVLMSASAITYREMALCNIAFAYLQMGDGATAEGYYRRTLEQFPESIIAVTSLTLIASARDSLDSSIRAQSVNEL